MAHLIDDEEMAGLPRRTHIEKAKKKLGLLARVPELDIQPDYDRMLLSSGPFFFFLHASGRSACFQRANPKR